MLKGIDVHTSCNESFLSRENVKTSCLVFVRVKEIDNVIQNSYFFSLCYHECCILQLSFVLFYEDYNTLLIYVALITSLFPDVLSHSQRCTTRLFSVVHFVLSISISLFISFMF